MQIREAGQYYQYHDAYDKDGVFFIRYDWLFDTKHNNGNGIEHKTYYLILENRELSFFEGVKLKVTKGISDSSLINPENIVQPPLLTMAQDDALILKIDFTNVALSYDQFNGIYTNSVHRNMVLDFFWDLYINQCFTHAQNYKELKLLFDADPYYSGVVAKLCYYKLVEGRHPYDMDIELPAIGSKGSLMSVSHAKEKIKSVKYFWKYLLDEKHETYFKYGMSSEKSNFFGFKDRRDLWFGSLEDELKPVLIKAKKKGLVFEEKDDYIKSSAKLLIKRYSLIDTLLYILPTRLGLFAKYSFVGLCSLILMFIAFYYWQMNIGSGRGADFKLNLDYDYLQALLWVFIVGIPLIHIIGSILARKKTDKLRLLVLFPQIYLPRLLIALCSGWLVFMTSEETTRMFDVSGTDENIVLIGLVFILGGAMLVLMYNEIKSTAPSESAGKLAFRSVKIFSLGFIMSMSIGYLFAGRIFNTLKIKNPEAMAETKSIKKSIDANRQRLDSLDLRLLKVDGLSERLNRFNISPEQIAKISSDIFTGGVGISPPMFFNVHVEKGKSQKNIADLTKVLNENISRLTNDGVFDTLKSIIPMDSSTFEMVNSLKKDTINLDQYTRLKWAISNFMSIETEKIKLAQLETRKTLDSLLDEDNLIISHFQDGSFYVNFHKTAKSNSISASEVEANLSSYIPFNQILNRAIIALFLGVFLQLVIQDKTITEPI